MSIKVLDYRREKQDNNSFVGLLKNPVFTILITEDKKAREVAIQLHGEFPFLKPLDLDSYEEEPYRNYIILKDYIMSDKGQNFLDRTYLDEDELVLGLFKVLVNKHSYFGWFKKKLLIVLEYLKYYSGKLGG